MDVPYLNLVLLLKKGKSKICEVCEVSIQLLKVSTFTEQKKVHGFEKRLETLQIFHFVQ